MFDEIDYRKLERKEAYDKGYKEGREAGIKQTIENMLILEVYGANLQMLMEISVVIIVLIVNLVLKQKRTFVQIVKQE